MKSTCIKITGLFLFCLLAPLPLLAQNIPANYKTISGIIKDNKSRKKLAFVSIVVPGTQIGTVSNTDGRFSVKIADSLNVSNLELSHIGYKTHYVPLYGENIADTTIYLEANSRLLKEIVIDNVEPLKLVQKAIDKIEINYTLHPALQTGFYRETIQKRRDYINISEAVMEIYKTPYNDGMRGERTQIIKGRKLISANPKDTLAVKLQGGPNIIIYSDIVKNADILLKKEDLWLYRFELDNPQNINDKYHYVVNFEPGAILPDDVLFYGRLFIERETLTISRAEFSVDMKDRSKVTRMVLKKKPPKLRFKPEEVSYIANYTEYNGRSYLNYVRNEVRFKCDWKRRLFSTNYTVVSEMVITGGKKDDITKIPNKVSFRQNQSLSDEVSSFYDENFWEDYNIIEPTESLESAVHKLKKKR